MQNELVAALSEIQNDIARCGVLRKELSMRRIAAPNLKAGSIVAMQNANAITRILDELNTLAILLDHAERVGIEEIARCSKLADAVALK